MTAEDRSKEGIAEELEPAASTALFSAPKRCQGRGAQPLPGPTYQLVLKPEEVGAAVVAILQDERCVALLQVSLGQRDQGPDLRERGT